MCSRDVHGQPIKKRTVQRQRGILNPLYVGLLPLASCVKQKLRCQVNQMKRENDSDCRMLDPLAIFLLPKPMGMRYVQVKPMFGTQVKR
jgi:hypothetical protein